MKVVKIEGIELEVGETLIVRSAGRECSVSVLPSKDKKSCWFLAKGALGDRIAPKGEDAPPAKKA